MSEVFGRLGGPAGRENTVFHYNMFENKDLCYVVIGCKLVFCEDEVLLCRAVVAFYPQEAMDRLLSSTFSFQRILPKSPSKPDVDVLGSGVDENLMGKSKLNLNVVPCRLH